MNTPTRNRPAVTFWLVILLAVVVVAAVAYESSSAGWSGL